MRRGKTGAYGLSRFGRQRLAPLSLALVLAGSASLANGEAGNATPSSGDAASAWASPPAPADANAFFSDVAQRAPRGAYPKYLLGEQSYWTVIGADGDDVTALIDEEGMIEVADRTFSIEPFLRVGGEIVSWSSARPEQSLRDGHLPIPVVSWRTAPLSLAVTAFAAGEAGRSILYAIYRVENKSETTQKGELLLAFRPFQVSPPWQALREPGGVSPIYQVARDGRVVRVKGGHGERTLISLTPPSGFGAAPFAQGSLTELLATDRMPSESSVSDETGYARGVLRYALDIEPGGHAEIVLAAPFHDPAPFLAALPAPGDVASHAASQLDATLRQWRKRLGGIGIRLPPAAGKLGAALRTATAHILVNRSGPALQPGPRTYARSWIRDGAFMSSALLQLGFAPEVRDYVRWYAGFQYEDGKVPCCIDARGPDPTPEHDSPGEFVYTNVELYRFTRDEESLRSLWPNVLRAVDYMESLRANRMGEAYRTPEKLPYYGLMPESISHEGYSKRPVHSYWDDTFALLGFQDAAFGAQALGESEQATRLARLRDEFRRDLRASIEATMALHDLDIIPASVELGDFDPTATSAALSPGREKSLLPAAALARSYERYAEEVRLRLAGESDWEAYTPYELRNVEALLRLGQRDQALALLDGVVADQRPAGWNQWPEIIWRDPSWPRFSGDMPHAWIGAEFIRALRSLLVYEREDGALVLGAGVPPAWLASGDGVAVRDLPTHRGPLTFHMRSKGPRKVELTIAAGVEIPPAGIVVHSPGAPLRSVQVNGRDADEHDADSVTLRALPARVLLEY